MELSLLELPAGAHVYLGAAPGIIFQVEQSMGTTVNSANEESYPLYPGKVAANCRQFSPHHI